MSDEKKKILISIVLGLFIVFNLIGFLSNNKLIWAGLNGLFVIGLVSGCKIYMKIFKMGIYSDKKEEIHMGHPIKDVKICNGCGKKLPMLAQMCPKCGGTFADTLEEKMIATGNLVICKSCHTLNTPGAALINGTGKAWDLESCECSNCGIKIAFPILDSEKSDLQRLHEIQKRYSDNRLAYLALHNKADLADKTYTLRIYCVYKKEYLTIQAPGWNNKDDIINLLSERGYFEPHINAYLPYFSNWPSVSGRIETNLLHQRSLCVCELEDETYLLRSERVDAPPNVCLYGCPDASALDDVSLVKTTEVIIYE